MGAYAASCAYFLIISFIPFFMIFVAICRKVNADLSSLNDSFLMILPEGLRSYVSTIMTEVDLKSYSYVPISIIVLLWSAAKVVHALTNGLNVIGKVKETRGWLFLRIRSMILVAISLLGASGIVTLSVFGRKIRIVVETKYPTINMIVSFIQTFRILFSYAALIILFLLIYKFLPNRKYSLKSQLPGALIVATLWMFISYLISLYYEHNANFTAIYGTLTGLILAMFWIYFMSYFLLFGAEINYVLLSDPNGNVFIQGVDVVKDARTKKKEIVNRELDEYSLWRPIPDEEEEKNSDEEKNPQESVDQPSGKTDEEDSGENKKVNS